MRQNNVVHLGVVGHIAVERVVAVGAGVHGLFVTFPNIVEIYQTRRLIQILTDGDVDSAVHVVGEIPVDVEPTGRTAAIGCSGNGEILPHGEFLTDGMNGPSVETGGFVGGTVTEDLFVEELFHFTTGVKGSVEVDVGVIGVGTDEIDGGGHFALEVLYVSS
jgi:hypothetical protein